METKRVICITLGCNETAVLKNLSRFEGAVSFTDIFETHRENTSLAYETQLGMVLGRLKHKQLIEWFAWENQSYCQITEKGRMMLLVLKK